MCVNICKFPRFFTLFRCYLLDDSGMLTFDPRFVTSNDRERHLYEGVSLAHRDGYIFSDFGEEGFIHQTFTDQLSGCLYHYTTSASGLYHVYISIQKLYGHMKYYISGNRFIPVADQGFSDREN